MNEPQHFLDHVLKKFPYSGKSDQFQRLTKFLIITVGKNANEVEEHANISHPTRRKIEATWNELTLEEQGFLLSQIGNQMMLAGSKTQ